MKGGCSWRVQADSEELFEESRFDFVFQVFRSLELPGLDIFGSTYSG